jgi:hypothetical protein
MQANGSDERRLRRPAADVNARKLRPILAAKPQARRPSSQAITRRRAGQKRLGLLLAGVLIVRAVLISSTGHSPAKTRNSTVKKTKVAKTHAPVAVDPLTTPSVQKWIAGRTGDVSAAVLNLKTGKEWLLNP